jgi:ABC-type polysaccharide/polyol phosphate export permease
MDKNINSLLCKLDDEIDKKCFEIKQRNRNRMLQSIFISACLLFIILPMMLVFTGISLWTFCIPAILFLTICFGFLSPLVFGNTLGGLKL